MIQKVNLAEKFSQFNERWSPRIAAQINDMHIKLAKLEGEFMWHQHVDEDELFLVIDGQLTIRLRDQDNITLNPGEFVVIPRGTEHLPIAKEPVNVILLEPTSTVNTGDIVSDRTVPNDRFI